MKKIIIFGVLLISCAGISTMQAKKPKAPKPTEVTVTNILDKDITLVNGRFFGSASPMPKGMLAGKLMKHLKAIKPGSSVTFPYTFDETDWQDTRWTYNLEWISVYYLDSEGKKQKYIFYPKKTTSSCQFGQGTDGTFGCIKNISVWPSAKKASWF